MFGLYELTAIFLILSKNGEDLSEISGTRNNQKIQKFKGLPTIWFKNWI